MAIGVSPSSDVLASALSAATYSKNKHIDIKGGLWLLLPAMVLTVAGCFLGYSISSTALGMVSCIFPIGLGAKFLIAKETKPFPFVERASLRTRRILSILSGAVVGTICGFSGAGGGMMMLFLLTSLLSYELKTAVGTSVFIMTFLALVGGHHPLHHAGRDQLDCHDRLCPVRPGGRLLRRPVRQQGQAQGAGPGHRRLPDAAGRVPHPV